MPRFMSQNSALTCSQKKNIKKYMVTINYSSPLEAENVIQHPPFSLARYKSTDAMPLAYQKAVNQLAAYGATEELIKKTYIHFEPNEQYQSPFVDIHASLLIYLVTGKNIYHYIPSSRNLELQDDQLLTVLSAVQEINQLSYEQLYALRANYAHGLRGDHLRRWDNKQITFSTRHAEVLTTLIQDHELSPEDAILAIEGKNKKEIKTALNTHVTSSSNSCFKP